jgi:hypothetical protein
MSMFHVCVYTYWLQWLQTRRISGMALVTITGDTLVTLVTFERKTI